MSTGVPCLDECLGGAGALDVLELVGESGSGKSRVAYTAVARLLVSTLPPSSGGPSEAVVPPDGRPHAVVLDCVHRSGGIRGAAETA